jgi:hypothetical protein
MAKFDATDHPNGRHAMGGTGAGGHAAGASLLTAPHDFR